MPELPEVETTCRGIEQHIVGKKIRQVNVYQASLRWPVTQGLHNLLHQQKVISVYRRAKYILIQFLHGSLILHLGMSGSLRLSLKAESRKKHDHVEFEFAKFYLRFHDPRRFGCVLWTSQVPEQHPLMAHLGPEPLTDSFNAALLYRLSRNKKSTIKHFIMDGKNVVGIGNIYACESLFRSGIHPLCRVHKISLGRYGYLVKNAKRVLLEAIQQGGTTLKDFTRSDGSPGYFALKLQVYGKKDKPCPKCGKAILSRIISQRNTFYCNNCQR